MFATKRAPMNAIIYSGILMVAFLSDEASAQAPKLDRSEKDVAAVTEYLIASKKGKLADFPLSLKKRDIYVYSFMSGVHKILPRGNDSNLLINIHTKDDPKGPRAVVFQFTVEPKLTTQELKEADKKLKELLAKRRVTQLHILEVRKANGKRASKDLMLVADPRK